MIIFTEANDTPAKVAHRYLGYNDESQAKEVKEANYNSFAWQMMNNSGYYAPDRALWFPVEGENTPQWERDSIIREFDWLTTTQRAGLHKAMDNNIDIHDVVHAHHLSSMANFFMGAGSIALDSTHSALEIRGDKMNDFAELIQQAKQQLGNIADATSQTARNEAAQAYKREFWISC